MDVDLMTTFMAALLILGWVGVVAGLVVPSLRSVVRPGALQLAAAVAVLATLSSLYLSGIAGLTPCRFCWWQRIFMYPLAIMLPIAAIRRDWSIRIYALPIAAIGLAISARHAWVQAFPSGDSCDLANPCSLKLVEAFGLLTIPQMTGLCFALVLALLVAGRPALPEEAS